MRLIRALAALTAACASLLVLPVSAAAATSDSQLTLVLTQRWQSSQPGAWTPYIATIRNDGFTDFTGDVFLSPNASTRAPSDGWPSYRARVVVPHGTERSVTLYVVEAPSGYAASLVDSGGRTVIAGATVAGPASASYAVAVLSDQPQAAQRIEALRPLTEASGYQSNTAGLHVSRFASAQAFPASAAYLAGLHAIVVDDFDASTLSDAQLRAMRDFVELGGSLVVAGGSAWRRTLLPLADHDLGLLRPQRTDQSPLQPLADLVARTTDLQVAAGVGEVKSGRTVLSAPAGPALAVEGRVGAGRILDLAFDPLDQTFANDDSGMAVLAWTFALDRSLMTASPSGNHGFQAGAANGFPKGPAGNPAGLAGSADDISSVLADTPLAQLPPVGLLGGLLVFYVLLAGPVNYIAVRSIRRGELMWVTVPALALLFTSAAYVSGTAARGSTYFDNDVQVLRVAPDGAVEAHGYHAVYPPHRGDFTLSIPVNTLASTVIGAAYTPSSGTMTAMVDSGSQTQVEMRNTPLGAPRTLQTLSVTHAPVAPSIGVDAHVKLVNGRVQGTIRNTGDRALENVRLVSGTGQVAVLAKELAPRATATVDAEYQEPGSAQTGSIPPAPVTQPPADYKQATVLRIASAQAVSGHQGDLSVVATTATGTEISIAGLTPSHSSIGGVVLPVAWESVDALSGVAPKPDLVMSSTPTPFHKDVFDLAMPNGYTGSQVKLNFFAMVQQRQAPGSLTPAGSVRSIEVYDWTTGAWQPLTLTATSTQQSIKLDPGTYSGGLVRVRVDEQATAQNLLSTLGLSEK